jgi:single-stranded-DNA-specific exonuclease
VETFSSAAAPWGAFDQLTRAEFAGFQEAGISFLHAQLLFNRGLRSPEAMRAFLDARLDQIPDPRLLIDMERALTRIQRALREREHITVYGDFDADGVTSAALLTRVLRRLGQPEELLSCYIPSRLQGTRGLSKEAIDLLHARGTILIITTDCGSSDVEEVAYAQSIGIDVIITDHHHPPAQLPQATAMINPWRPDCTYSERYLCGVGIAFKLAQALYQVYGYTQETWELLDLVAVGTVGDVAILLGENHALVRAGMQRLNQTRNPGLQALIQVSRLLPGRIRERDISFALAPRINAAGRMKHADLAFRLLTTSDRTEASTLAAELEELNLSRQRQTEELMKLVREQARLQADKQVILVYGEKENWPEGIIGLVAGKLSEETRRPVFVLSQDTEASRGSARSPEDFNIILALQAARENLFERYGGHAQAAGFTIANKNIPELHAHLLHWYEESKITNSPVEEVVETSAGEDLAGIGIEPEGVSASANRKIDLVITKPELLKMETLNSINQLGPFGAGNPEPTFRIDSLQLVRRWTSGNDGRHLRVRLRSNTHLIFNGTLLRGGKRIETLREGTQVQVIFSLEQAWSPPESEAKQEVWFKILEITPL